MNHNPIEELRHLETPVSEQEWAAITSDKRYMRKFGRKGGLTPKGRAALIGGVAAALIAVPVLVKTLTHKGEENAQPSVPVAEVSVTQPTDQNAPSATTPLPTSAATAQRPPAKVSTTSQAAGYERSTMASVIEKRSQTNRQIAKDNTDVPVLFGPGQHPGLTLEDVKVNPERPGTQLEPSREERIVYSCSPQTKHNPAVSETTVDENGEEVAKSHYSPSEEDPASTADEFFIPSAFTPNGDGLNDLFYVKANFEPRNYELSIFNRNGDLVFLTRDINTGWDGMQHGGTLMHGMYVYIIKYKDREGNEQRKQGQILLVP